MRRVEHRAREGRAARDQLGPDYDPMGNRNMFTMECPNPMQGNIRIGIHAAMILPEMDVGIIAATTPVETIQLI